MALNDLLQLSSDRKKTGISEERLKAIIPIGRQYVAYWREYPDMFIDFLLTFGNPQEFKFYFYQRVFLRAAMRHKYMYATFPREICAGYDRNIIKKTYLIAGNSYIKTISS